MQRARWCLPSLWLFLAAGCNDPNANFSQNPGFAAWYAANPPITSPPNDKQTALLDRHRPRIFLPKGHEGPVDFYRDYIGSGVLQGRDGEMIADRVDRNLLNLYKTDPAVVFTHQPVVASPEASVYGGISMELVDWPGCQAPLPVTFLTYHLVFRMSGLPAGMPGWQAAGLGLIGDLDDWHQLDHYTALTLMLTADPSGTLRPLTATFQQHNYQRTFLLDDKEGRGRLPLPADGRLQVDVAIRSNELYPHQPGRTLRRAVSFLDVDSAVYMVDDGEAPWLAANDVTDPAEEIDPPLVFLPPNDAFYTFQGWLGERRRLPGRDGPPGADYNTLPALKPRINQVAVSWWYEGNRDWLERFQTLFQDGRPEVIDPTPFLKPLAEATYLPC